MYENREYNGNLVLSMLTGIIGTIMLLSLSIMINKNMALSYVGKYSIVVLCAHLFVFHKACCDATYQVYGIPKFYNVTNILFGGCIPLLFGNPYYH